MSRLPYSHIPHDDFLARCGDLEGDEIAVYTIAFFFMMSRRAPIDDDMAWLGRKCGIGTRRTKQIRAKLIDLGKWQERDGQIGDPAALAIIVKANGKTATARASALARWDNATQPRLDLGNGVSGEHNSQISANSADANASGHAGPAPKTESGEKPAKKAEKRAEKPPVKEAVPGEETVENQRSDAENRIHDSRARATPEPEPDSHTNNPESITARDGKLDHTNVRALLKATCSAAGFNPIKPEHVEAARAQVLAWRNDGIDFDEIVIPTIRKIIADSADPTSSLLRFDRHVRHAHARAAAKPKAPPPRPADDPPENVSLGDDPRFDAIRDSLRRSCGGRTYDGWLKPIQYGTDGTELHCRLPSQFMADWVQTHFADRFRSEAQTHGFTLVRIYAVSSAQHSGP